MLTVKLTPLCGKCEKQGNFVEMDIYGKPKEDNLSELFRSFFMEGWIEDPDGEGIICPSCQSNSSEENENQTEDIHQIKKLGAYLRSHPDLNAPLEKEISEQAIAVIQYLFTKAEESKSMC